MGKKREGVAAELKWGERGPDVTGRGGNRRPTWGKWERRERRDSKIESRPSWERRRAGERGKWAREKRVRGRRGRCGPGGANARHGGGCGRGGERLEVGGGPDKWAPPVGDPGREEGARAKLGRGLRPAQQGTGRKEGKWAGGPLREKEKEKRKRKKGISRDLNIVCAQF